jgi:hypothetical protein
MPVAISKPQPLLGMPYPHDRHPTFALNDFKEGLFGKRVLNFH